MIFATEYHRTGDALTATCIGEDKWILHIPFGPSWFYNVETKTFDICTGEGFAGVQSPKYHMTLGEAMGLMERIPLDPVPTTTDERPTTP